MQLIVRKQRETKEEREGNRPRPRWKEKAQGGERSRTKLGGEREEEEQRKREKEEREAHAGGHHDLGWVAISLGGADHSWLTVAPANRRRGRRGMGVLDGDGWW